MVTIIELVEPNHRREKKEDSYNGNRVIPNSAILFTTIQQSSNIDL
jgi:hypothetical protein